MPLSPYVRELRARVGPLRLRMPSVTALVYDAEGRILLVRLRDGGVWSTPGGRWSPARPPRTP
jgi:ADP-ribose pyrophosphatase YjhB (NUDIX family)